MKQLKSARWAAALCLGVSVLASTTNAADEPFRPEHGKFAPLEKSHSVLSVTTFWSFQREFSRRNVLNSIQLIDLPDPGTKMGHGN